MKCFLGKFDILYGVLTFLLHACNPIPLSKDIDALNYPASISLQLVVNTGLADDTLIVRTCQANTSDIDALLTANNLSYSDIKSLLTNSLNITSDGNLNYIERADIFFKSFTNDTDSFLIAFSENFSNTSVELELFGNSYSNNYLTQPDSISFQGIFILSDALTQPDTLNVALSLTLMGKI